MLARLVLLFTIVPLVELALLFRIAQWTNWWVTILLVIGSGAAGVWVARHEGLRCWTDARRKMARGELPTDSLFDGLLILLAGGLLIVPGVLTDAAGIALLIPPVRRWVRRRVADHFRARFVVGPCPDDSWTERREEIIDVRMIDVEPKDEDRRPRTVDRGP
jgi:UPF0716 protein FxsA